MRFVYHLPLSPYSRKVRLVLAEKRLPFELRMEKVWERRPGFLDVNPAATVPVRHCRRSACPARHRPAKIRQRAARLRS